MKRSHIILLLLVAAVVGTVISTFSSSSRSVGFATAQADPGEEYKMSGTLVREEPVVYDPEVDPNRTEFHMRDKEGNVQRVLLNKPKPTGLENSESVDIYGHFDGATFTATEMLMKCPSKYNEHNHVMMDSASAEL
jgi:cytochrome c-type biogenesis protein CcmE